MDAKNSAPEETPELLAAVVLDLLEILKIEFCDFQLAILRIRGEDRDANKDVASGSEAR